MSSRLVAGMTAVAAALGLTACATPSNPAMMTLAPTADLVARPGDLGYRSVAEVRVSGGRSTNPMWMSEVSNADFKLALEASLAAAGYTGAEGTPMTVSASLIDLKQPFAGFDMTVTSQVRYAVTRADQTIFDETVSATGTARMGESLLGVERLRLANERSIQENIRAFLTRFRARADPS